MRVAFITVGDPRRLTGGYLYHARLFSGLTAQGVQIDEIVASGAALAEQLSVASSFGQHVDVQAYDVVVIDALARGVCSPWIEQWLRVRPVVALVHQLPSIAEADESHIAVEQAHEAPLLRADRLIAVSRHGRDILVARGVPPQRITIIEPGYDRLPVALSRRSPPPLPDESARAVCVAQWVPRKGITTLIRAWQQAAPTQATLELIGETDADSNYAAEVYRAIAAAPSASIVVRGVVSDAELQRAYEAADLFVLPSRFEGYGMVYAEALAHGLPIIACDVGPVPELVSPAAGLFVSPDDVDALTHALNRLLHDSSLRQRLAAGARRRVAALPGWDDTVDRFRQMLITVVAQRV